MQNRRKNTRKLEEPFIRSFIVATEYPIQERGEKMEEKILSKISLQKTFSELKGMNSEKETILGSAH